MEIESKVLQFCLRLERVKVKLFLENIKTESRKQLSILFSAIFFTQDIYYVNEIQITKKPSESRYKNLLSFTLPFLRYWQVCYNSVGSITWNIEFTGCDLLCCFSCSFRVSNIHFYLSQPIFSFYYTTSQVV